MKWVTHGLAGSRIWNHASIQRHEAAEAINGSKDSERKGCRPDHDIRRPLICQSQEILYDNASRDYGPSYSQGLYVEPSLSLDHPPLQPSTFHVNADKHL